MTGWHEGSVLLSRPGVANAEFWLCAGLGLLAITSVLVGFLTPICCAVLALGLLQTLWLPPTIWRGSAEAKLLRVDVYVIAFAVGALGPGAFSLDAHFFGRREIIFPH
jgi:uncharacterized membrane protein YphA (DoxX/SURF4 family)